MTQTIATLLQDKLKMTVRELTHADEAALYTLQKANQSFYDLFLDHHLTKREAVADLDETPLRSVEGAKHYLGIFDGDQLLASVDLVVDYPLPQVTWIGQFMWLHGVVSNEQASEWATAVLQLLKSLEAVQVQLMVLKKDSFNQQFWLPLGFEEVADTQAQIHDKTLPVLIYQADLNKVV